VTATAAKWMAYTSLLSAALRWGVVFLESDPTQKDIARGLASLSGIEAAVWFVVVALVTKGDR
jgi:hypothetical protein